MKTRPRVQLSRQWQLRRPLLSDLAGAVSDLATALQPIATSPEPTAAAAAALVAAAAPAADAVHAAAARVHSFMDGLAQERDLATAFAWDPATAALTHGGVALAEEPAAAAAAAAPAAVAAAVAAVGTEFEALLQTVAQAAEDLTNALEGQASRVGAHAPAAVGALLQQKDMITKQQRDMVTKHQRDIITNHQRDMITEPQPLSVRALQCSPRRCSCFAAFPRVAAISRAAVPIDSWRMRRIAEAPSRPAW